MSKPGDVRGLEAGGNATAEGTNAQNALMLLRGLEARGNATAGATNAQNALMLQSLHYGSQPAARVH